MEENTAPSLQEELESSLLNQSETNDLRESPEKIPPSFLTAVKRFYIHVHPPSIRLRTLRPSTTLGLGIGLLSLFVILTVTGILLMVYYKPSAAMAYNSMKDIHYVVPAGLFVRNMHRWAAHLMVLFVFLHMARVFYTEAYKGGRRLNWIVGIALFLLTLALSFTGYVLPWDQLGYWAATIAAHILASTDELARALDLPKGFHTGDFQAQLLFVSSDFGQEALIRFYLLHVVALPLLMALLIALHVWRIRKDGGLALPDNQTEPPSDIFLNKIPALPYLFRAELLVFMTVLFLCTLLSAFFDAPLKGPANPLVPENPAKAPWYFLGNQELVSYSAFSGGILIPAVVVFALLLIPYIDRKAEKPGTWFGAAPARRVFFLSVLFAGTAAVLAVAVPVRYGWLPQWFPNVPPILVILLNPGMILTLLFALWSIGLTRGLRSTRLGAIALFTCFLTGYAVLTAVGTFFRGPFWEFYWSKSQWPGF